MKWSVAISFVTFFIFQPTNIRTFSPTDKKALGTVIAAAGIGGAYFFYVLAEEYEREMRINRFAGGKKLAHAELFDGELSVVGQVKNAKAKKIGCHLLSGACLAGAICGIIVAIEGILTNNHKKQKKCLHNDLHKEMNRAIDDVDDQLHCSFRVMRQNLKANQLELTGNTSTEVASTLKIDFEMLRREMMGYLRAIVKRKVKRKKSKPVRKLKLRPRGKTFLLSNSSGEESSERESEEEG